MPCVHTESTVQGLHGEEFTKLKVKALKIF